MKLLISILSFLVEIEALKTRTSTISTLNFLDDFFKDKNVEINLFSCWNYETKREFALQFGSRKEILFNSEALNPNKQLNGDFTVIDVRYCEIAWDLLETLNHKDLFKLPYKYIILINAEEFNTRAANARIANFTMLINSDVLFAKEVDHEKFNLVQAYKLTPDSSLIWEIWGAWSNQKGLTIYLSPNNFSLRRRNFNKMKFKVALLLEHVSSLNHLHDFRFPWTDVYQKQNFGPIQRLLEYCNIDYDITRVTNYTHLFNKLGKQFLLTGSAPYMTKQLLSVIDFVRIQNAPKVGFMLKRPPTSYVNTIFTDALDAHVWYAMLICLILLSMALFVMLNVEGRREAIKDKETFSTSDLALIALEAVCQQGTSTDPRSYSARILEVIMFCAFMFVYVAYSANILVLLQSTTDVNSFDEIEQLRINFAGMNTSDMVYYHSGIGDELYGEQIKSKQLFSISEGMEKVRAGLFAYFLEWHYGYNYVKESFTDYEVCGLQEIHGYFETNLGYISLARDSPYTELFKVVSLKIDEFGFRRRHYNNYFIKPQCYSKGSSFDTIGIPETYQAMFLVVFGVIGGLFILFLELFLFRLVAKLKEKRKINIGDD